MSENFAKKMAIEYAKTMKKKAAEANLKRASAAVVVKVLSETHAQVIVPGDEAPNAYAFNYGKRHPLNYKNQVNAEHAHGYQRWMGRTPHRDFRGKTAKDIPTADRALDAGMNDVIESDWDKGW